MSDGNVKVKKLIWISDSMISALSINPTCDWVVIAYRSGMICILPVGSMMGRHQKKSEYWKSDDATYLSSQIKTGTIVTCLKWWTSHKFRNLCIIGRSDGDLLVIDLTNGSTLFLEKFSEDILSIDVLHTFDRKLSYCFITTKSLCQWKLLLEEIHGEGNQTDSEFGFDILEFSYTHSSSIVNSNALKKGKGRQMNPAYLPSKLYQFPKSTYLKSQFYNGKYFLGAYDNVTGRYKLFDCDNLDSSLYEFQLPLSVVDICVTEDLIFLIVLISKEANQNNIRKSIFAEHQNFKLCVIYRQYAHFQILEKHKLDIFSGKRREPPLFKLSNMKQESKFVSKSLMVEFNLFGLQSSAEIISILSFQVFFNFHDLENIVTEEQNELPRKSSWRSFVQAYKTIANSSLIKDKIYSKWSVEEIKTVAPVFIITSSGISVCYMSQCFEDKCIDHLLSYQMKEAEYLGAGLKLDMNELYRYTAHLLVSRIAQLSDNVTKSKKSVILEYFELASASMKSVLSCISQYWSTEKCLLYALSQVANINKMSPTNRVFLSNATIQLFAHFMSDPFDLIDGTEKKRNKYYEKFRRFVIGNCFFNDLKAAKIMFHFGLIDEAFFIAKEKGCVLEFFNHIIENNYTTKWFDCFSDPTIKEKFVCTDRDFVLSNIGVVELEIVARSDPKLIKSLAEFICQLFVHNISSIINLFSFQTTIHLSSIFNPYGSILDTLFRIYASTNINDLSICGKKDLDMSIMFHQNMTSSRDSLDGATQFSETLKICREIGPELLAYCLLITCKDNQLQEVQDYIYFVQMYSIVITLESEQKNSDHPDFTNFEMDGKSQETYNSLLNLIGWNKTFKQKKNILSSYWTKLIKPKLLNLREELCVSVSVLDIDLFEDSDNNLINNLCITNMTKTNEDLEKKPIVTLSDAKPNQRCKIKLLGFNKDNSKRVFLFPKPIETGKEIIRQVSLGKRHALILTETGSLYAAGSNTYGQLGIEHSFMKHSTLRRRNQCLNIINPVLINLGLNEDEIILSISTGDYHSGALIVRTSGLIQKSYIITWGWGLHGQLGHGDVENQKIPKPVDWDFTTLSKLIKDDKEEFPIELAMGCYHSVVLTNKGGVYVFGNNYYGQLGLPNLYKTSRPILIQNLPHNVVRIDTKYFHTVCCTSSNEIFEWGIHPNLWQNNYKSYERIATIEKIDTDHLLDNEKITQISCGTIHTTIVTESKLVYCFGSNIYGQLGSGNRREITKLVEVKLPLPIDYVSSDDGITVAINVSEKSTKIFVWGRCSHLLVREYVKNLSSDTVKPQLLVEYQHVIENNLLWKNCFGIDTVLNGIPRIINKHQLMIIFLNFSKYIDRNKFLQLFEQFEEFDLISDYFLMNESIIQSLFWRIKSLIHRLENDVNKENLEIINDDIQIIFKFYIQLTDNEKFQSLKKPILVMITGFFKTHNIPWEIYENIMRPLLITNAMLIATYFVKFSLESALSSGFIRDLLIGVFEENINNLIINDNIERMELTAQDIDRFFELIKAGTAETIYDAADDYKVVFFSRCKHASVIGRFKEQQLKQISDKLRKRQLNLSCQMLQRLYNDSSILPDCLDCLSQTFKF